MEVFPSPSNLLDRDMSNSVFHRLDLFVRTDEVTRWRNLGTEGIELMENVNTEELRQDFLQRIRLEHQKPNGDHGAKRILQDLYDQVNVRVAFNRLIYNETAWAVRRGLSRARGYLNHISYLASGPHHDIWNRLMHEQSQQRIDRMSTRASSMPAMARLEDRWNTVRKHAYDALTKRKPKVPRMIVAIDIEQVITRNFWTGEAVDHQVEMARNMHVDWVMAHDPACPGVYEFREVRMAEDPEQDPLFRPEGRQS